MAESSCKSIYDLAQLSGVSYGTVSRVLNGRGNVSAAARQAVLDAAAKSNFKPRMQARKTTVGLLLDLERNVVQEKHGYLDLLLLHLVYQLSARGVSVELFTHNTRQNLNGGLIDGVICVDDDLDDVASGLKNIPVVVLNGRPDGRFSRLCSDHLQSGQLAADYLLRQGRRRCGILLDGRNWGNAARLQGFCDTCAAAGCPVVPELTGFVAEQSEVALLRQMLDARPDALFLAGEDNILEHLNILHTLDAEYAGRLTLISMDNPSVSRYLTPPMATVAQPLRPMLQCAVETLLAQIQARKITITEQFFPNTLITR